LQWNHYRLKQSIVNCDQNRDIALAGCVQIRISRHQRHGNSESIGGHRLDFSLVPFQSLNQVLAQIHSSFLHSHDMFMFKKSTPGLLPIAKESQEEDSSSERDAMLDHEYQERSSRSRSRQIWSSNVPWILTTIALSLYIFISHPSPHKNDTPWSPTDVGKLVNKRECLD
jgi:hypothetical protein